MIPFSDLIEFKVDHGWVFQVSCIVAGDDQEVFSFSYGGAADHLLAGGCKEQVWHLNAV